jgi:hypothetical protein
MTNYNEMIVPFGASAPAVKNPSKAILGGKGLGLQEMSSLGIDVPPVSFRLPDKKRSQLLSWLPWDDCNTHSTLCISFFD